MYTKQFALLCIFIYVIKVAWRIKDCLEKLMILKPHLQVTFLWSAISKFQLTFAIYISHRHLFYATIIPKQLTFDSTLTKLHPLFGQNHISYILCQYCWYFLLDFILYSPTFTHNYLFSWHSIFARLSFS